MGRIEGFGSVRDGAAATRAPVACFGEPGMHQHPGHPAHVPPAAGLFGVASGQKMPLPQGCAAGRG